MSIADQAAASLEAGLNCAQSVLCEFAEELGLSREAALRIAAPFGGGMGRQGEVCGAVSGALMALGLRFGSSTVPDPKAKDLVYKLTAGLIEAFQDRNRSVRCRDLLACDLSMPEGFLEAREKGLFKTVCPRMVSDAAEIAEAVIGLDGATLRRFLKEDAFPVKLLVHRTIDACYTQCYPPAAILFFRQYHSIESIVRDAEEGTTVVLDTEWGVAATGTLVGEYVKRVFVDPLMQKRGLGRLIMHQLEGMARLNGAQKINLSSALISKSFYDSLGYSVIREISSPVEGGENLDYYEMEKRFDSN